MTDEKKELLMETRIVKTEIHQVPLIPPANISRSNACRIKGHSHPGSFVDLPGGQKIHMQFDVSPLSVRNGLTSSELFAALRNHFATYQNTAFVDFAKGDELIEYPKDQTANPPRILEVGDEMFSVFDPLLASEETEELVKLLDRCWLLTQKRQLDREARGVRFQDKA